MALKAGQQRHRVPIYHPESGRLCARALLRQENHHDLVQKAVKHITKGARFTVGGQLRQAPDLRAISA